MGNPSSHLRRLKPDLTPYLFHFTNGINPDEKMKSILAQKKLVSSKGFVCFTDSPLSMLEEQFKYMAKFPTPMYSAFGIGFTRDMLIKDFGCRPVIYGDEKEGRLIDSSLHWRYELLDVSTHDFTWLREWRISGNVFNFEAINPKDVVVIAPTEDKLHTLTVDMDINVGFDYDNGEKKEFPYPIYTFRRKWKGIPLSQAASFKDDHELQEALVFQEIGEEVK